MEGQDPRLSRPHPGRGVSPGLLPTPSNLFLPFEKRTENRTAEWVKSLESLQDPDLADIDVLAHRCSALKLAIVLAWQETRRLQEGAEYLKTRHLQKMQVSWSA